jgi:hypothetical protein
MNTQLKKQLTKHTLLGFSVGIITSLVFGYIIGLYTFSGTLGYELPNHTSTYTGEVHVHADFRMVIENEYIRFTDAKYQSEVGHTLDASQHFHDGSDDVIHRHANNVTIADFFHSLGITLTDTCITLDTKQTYCSDATNTLMLFINGTPTTSIATYTTIEKDRILLYYGNPKNPYLPEYLTDVTDESCLYSHTCPERGEPPTESCGLTCDVANIIQKQH